MRAANNEKGGLLMRYFSLALAGFLSASWLSAAEMPSAGQPADRAAIQNLIAKYATALDTLDADMYASVFAPDAEFTFGGNTYKGRDQIRGVITGIKERNAGRPASNDPPRKSYHAITNTFIEFVNDHEAQHRSYWQTISGASAGPFTVGGMGVYQDTLVKQGGEWLIKKREILQ
jgi:3-phenylpropionate/cinnamic acid dioxygenase small subunit